MDAPDPSARSCRVLVVDDNEDAAASLSELLTLGRHQVRSVYDGRDVLPLAQVFRPQAVLLDLGLPGLDGLEVARQLRAQPWAAKVLLVAVTGRGQAADHRASAVAGFDRHLVKPVDPAVLLDLLARLAPP